MSISPLWLWMVSNCFSSAFETKGYLLPSFYWRQWVWPLPTRTLSSGLWATQVIMVCLLTTETASFNWVQSSPAYLPYILGIVSVFKSTTWHTQKWLHCTRLWHTRLFIGVLDAWVKKEVWNWIICDITEWGYGTLPTAQDCPRTPTP